MELMNRIRERVVAWQKKRVRTVVFPLAGKLCAVETVEGKRLGQWQADYDGDTPNLKECFLSLKAAGLRGKKLWLLVNADSLRWSRKRYPQMTEEEFAESMEWEADRVFHTEEAIAMGHRVLSHDEEGWEALLHALPRVDLGAWEMGAHEVGLTITRAFPVTDIPLQEGPHFILYMRRRSAMLLFRRGDLWESRILHLADEGKASLFMGRQSPIIIMVTDKELRDELSALNAKIMGTKMDPFYGAPELAIVLADKDRPTHVYDGSLVIGNMMLAAESLGIGSCWIHRAKEEFELPEGKAILEKLGIKGDYEGIGHCILGYAAKPAGKAAPRKKDYIYRIG